jgi:rfaE bifunctional protein nucleotidyltransferase chain/domain
METSPTRRKILSLPELARSSEQIRARDGVLVLTNGCFDILHVGHVRYLCAARALGTALAVAVNSDASVNRLKGPGRPVTNEADRAEILAALEFVDYVTVFDGDTAEEVVDAVRPGIYVKGGDYSEDPGADAYPAEARIAVSHGGAFRTLPYVSNRSSSAVIEALQRGENAGY